MEYDLSVRQLRAYLEQLTAARRQDDKAGVQKKRARRPFQPIRFAETKRGGFDLAVKYRRREDVPAIIETLRETIEKLERELEE